MTRGSPPAPRRRRRLFANADTAQRLIGWQATHPIADGIADALKWDNLREAKMEELAARQ